MEGIRWPQLIAISLAWVFYGSVHSFLASLKVKRWVARHFPRWMPAYRLFFNLIAFALLPLPLGLTYAQRGPWLWQWTGPLWWLANGLALLAIWGFVLTLRDYDSAEFLGFRQLQTGRRAVEDQESFRLSPLHRFVRHPWYSLGLVLIWTRDMDVPLFVSALWVSLYLFLGSRLEEQKLLFYHGERYRRYRALVPGLLPRPGRYLRKDQVRDLLD